MPLRPGTRFGAYEVIGLESVGGMGEVYAARDTKLAKQVAIKILPDRFSHDPHRLERLQREAHVTSARSFLSLDEVRGLGDERDEPSIVADGRPRARAIRLAARCFG